MPVRRDQRAELVQTIHRDAAAVEDGLAGVGIEAMELVVALRAQHLELTSSKDSQSATRTAVEKSLAEVTKNRDELLVKLETMAGELAGAKQEHGLAFAALDRDRDSLRASKEALAAEFADHAGELNALTKQWAIKQGPEKSVCGLNSDTDVAQGDFGAFTLG